MCRDIKQGIKGGKSAAAHETEEGQVASQYWPVSDNVFAREYHQ